MFFISFENTNIISFHDCKVLIAFNKSWCLQHTIHMKGLGAYYGTNSVTKICSISYISAMLSRLSQVVINDNNICIIPIPNPNHVNFKLLNLLLRKVYVRLFNYITLIVETFPNTPRICVTFVLQLLSSLASGKIQTFFFFDSIFYKAV